MYESQCDQMFRQQENINEIIREIENEWKERLDAKEREVKILESKVKSLKEEIRSMESELALVRSDIDVSEIRAEEGGLMMAVEGLAKDVGFQYTRKGIENALEESEVGYTVEDKVQVILKASSKIRELRELIENLSKKLCLSENNDNTVIGKLKREVEKLRTENRKLMKARGDVVKAGSRNCGSKDEDVEKQKMLFIAKHNLKPAMRKNLKIHIVENKTSAALQKNLNNLKSMKSLKERLQSPINDTFNNQQNQLIFNEFKNFEGMKCQSYATLHSPSHSLKLSSPTIRIEQENDRNIMNLVPEKLISQMTLDGRTFTKNIFMKKPNHKKSESTINKIKEKPRSRHTNSMINLKII